MTEAALYRSVLLGWFVLSAVTFVVLLGRTAPYGRHARDGWGRGLSPRLAWLLMEAPAAIVILAFAIPALRADGHAQAWLLLALWELHYLQRAFVYPFRIRSPRLVPFSVVSMAVFFNGMNGWLNARGITTYGPELGRVSLAHPRVVVGAALFLVGLVVNLHADARLFALPRGADGGYTIPRGGLFELVSCPNYLGELLEWTGFAIAAGSLAGLSFLAWTAANLVPRALAHHRWYRETFPCYPSGRRALVPYLL